MKYSGKLFVLGKAQCGFTLIELLVSIAVLSILLTQASSVFDDWFQKRRLISASEQVYSFLQIARSQAVTKSQDIYVNFEIDGGSNWKAGISETEDCDLEQDSSGANPCFLVIDDGDGVIDENDYVQYRLSSDDFPEINITNVTFGSDEAEFRYVRGTAKAGSIKLESENGYRLKVITSMLGRIRMCSPEGEHHVIGYTTESCSW